MSDLARRARVSGVCWRNDRLDGVLEHYNKCGAMNRPAGTVDDGVRSAEERMKHVAVALAGAAVLVATGLYQPMPHNAVLGDSSVDQAMHIYLPHVLAPTVDGAELVYVPAGDFLMGSTNNVPSVNGNEKPQHPVYLDAYWIDKTEVTNAMFGRFVGDATYETDAERLGTAWVYTRCSRSSVKGAYWRRPEGPGSNVAGRKDHPVVQVTSNDADAYCRWAGRRLPTEAEWEKAARGTDGRTYPWGNAPPAGNLVNYADVNLGCPWADPTQDDGYERTAPVGTYPDGASPYGALDMAGNVCEWVADWYDGEYYGFSPRRNPLGPGTGSYRVVRGGSWDDGPSSMRSAKRDPNVPPVGALWYGIYGFRCARP